MVSFHVYFKAGSDNIELNIPDIYRDSESETTTDQLRTYIANQIEKNYTDLCVDVKRGKGIKRKCNDYVIENEDDVYFYESSPQSVIDVNKIKMRVGFSSHIENLCALNEYSQVVLNKILSIEENHKNKIEDVTRIFNAFLEKVNDSEDRSFISLLTISNYSTAHSSCYPFFQIENKYYFCNRNKEGMPKGIGYMFDFDTLTYYQGQFHDSSIYHGKSVCISDDGFYTTCVLYVDGMLSHNGFKKYLFRNEIYSGCFVNNFYANNGCLSTNEGIYEGKFKNGLKSIIGNMKYSNGDSYIGYWCQGKQSFHGKMIYSNGDQYIGTWYDGKKEEFGSYFDKKMNITYVGTFKDDKRLFQSDEFKLYKGNHMTTNITGAYEVELLKNSNGDKAMKIAKTCYDGSYLLSCSSNNIPCDEFTQRQCFYTGNFDFMRHFYGYGKFYINPESTIINNITENEEFSESYIKNKFNGFHIYHGIFNENKLNGFGMVTYRNGDRYVGNFKDTAQNGFGTILKIDGSRYSGFWNSGRMIHQSVTPI